MPSLQDLTPLEELAKNIFSYKYYSGVGTFNQNNLPYGKDTPGGGNSTQPFVVRKVDERWSPSNIDEGFTRFGALTLLSRTVADVLRVSKFLYSTPKGPLFLFKQTGLQRMSPNIDQVNSEDEGGKVADTQIYGPAGLTTLAEVGVVGAGVHFNRHGIFPKVSDPNRYQNYILEKDKNGENRLYSLTSKLSKDYAPTLLKYQGGPESFFGIGKTTIKRYYNTISSGYLKDTDRSEIKINQGFIYFPHSQLFSIEGDSIKGFTYKSFNNPGTINIVSPDGETLQTNVASAPEEYDLRKVDFRKVKNHLRENLLSKPNLSKPNKETEKYYTLPTSNYPKHNLETRVGISRARRPQDKVDYSSKDNKDYSTADRINSISIYYSDKPSDEGGKIKDVNEKEIKAATINDLVKFRIKVLDNDKALSSNYGVYIIFRAYITNIRRNVSAKWDPYQYVGRGESFYVYDGFTETLTVSFVIAASSRDEMKPLYQKLNYLVSSMAPDYSSAGAMRGNISELTIGDLFLQQPGIITSFDMVVDEDSNWEIAMQEPDSSDPKAVDNDMHELPHIIKCTLTFIPMYNFLPRKSGKSKFFGIDGLSEGTKTEKQWLRNIKI